MKYLNNFKKRGLILTIILVLSYLVLSYKLINVPPGINLDEALIGYNASLIEKNLHDENNRFLPPFVLTLEGSDWKQPINVYTTVLVFKILGRSYFSLRFVSVIIALVSGLIFYKLLGLFFSFRLSLVGFLLYITSPSILIQSHLALENIALLPFFLGWIYFLFAYSRSKINWKIVLSGFCLGLSFYAYKGMHAVVPVYILASIGYLLIVSKEKIKSIILFLIGIISFLLPIPWLQTHYAGAIYDPVVVSFPSYFEALYRYLSSFDLSFLFVKGDKILIHSTGYHGMFLLPILFLFFLGLFQIIQAKKINYYFILIVLLITPLPLTLVDSIDRASRLMPLIPLVTFIAVLGIKRIIEYQNTVIKYILLCFLSVAVVTNYANLLNYYWGDYPGIIRSEFAPDLDSAFKVLKFTAVERNQAPYIENSFYSQHKPNMQFFWEVYFPNQTLRIWNRENSTLPLNGLVLTAIKGGNDMINYQEISGLGNDRFYIVGKK